MMLRELLERRAAIIAEMRGIADKPNGSAGDLSQEQEQRFDTLKGELSGIEQRIGRRRMLDEAERRMAGTPIAGTGDNRLDAETRNYSLLRAIASQGNSEERRVGTAFRYRSVILPAAPAGAVLSR